MSSELWSEMVSKAMENYKDITFKQLRFIKLIFYGAPRAGKSTLRKQLLRHVEGVKLQFCGNMEPSTPIAEVCGPIFVERIAMTNEGNNEWKWSVQKLDDIAKALLRCFGNKQLQTETKSSHLPIASVNSTSIENNVHQNTTAEPQQSAEPLAVQDMDTAPPPRVQEKTSNPIHPATVIESSSPIACSGINIVDIFLNAVKTGKWEGVMSALDIDKAMFLQIIDGGGQPSFQEIFPLLINGLSLTLLIFKLTDDLEKLQNVQYQPESGSEGQKAWEDNYVVKDIISHALASFAVQKDTTTPFLCNILLVGTHKDKLRNVSQDPHEDEESCINDKITSIAQQLDGWLCNSKAYKSIKVRSIESLIHGIDNNNEHDIVSVKSKIEEMISQFDSEDIPAPWLVFDFVLHKYAKQKELRKLEKSDCKEIATNCGVKVEDIDAVLHYLHQAGTLLYYSDIPKLNQHVIIDFQLIFDSISNIIIKYYDDNSHLQDKSRFKEKGELNTSVLKSVEGCLEVDELIHLLKHRHIISEMEEKIMFMPSVLPKVDNKPSNSSTFLVLFDHGYCPVGLFCAATTRLIVKHKWTLNRNKSQFRNKINFYCTFQNKTCGVIFSAFSTHYEVCLMGEGAKCMIYQDINDAFVAVCKDMQYSSPSYGFYCPKECKYGDASYPQYQHPATCAFDCESLEMKCYYMGTPSPLTDEQKQWLPQVRVNNAWSLI